MTLSKAQWSPREARHHNLHADIWSPDAFSQGRSLPSFFSAAGSLADRWRDVSFLPRTTVEIDFEEWPMDNIP